ncbi:SpoIIE family protein phosphatase [Calycomorphotria hydatis]|uniref:Phosphoserine phosphatase RsbU n=1 Tax=Calycomorphotria hydatis TaxID=2528027 RepID=A0A517T5J3_9PLAN|nr:SpoIIE family protein phosphatase [Calycomorphotria hydatis]QDT63652.1 Phosphoserine phosphatase RsbU [Calycomorphotria hydatis]
MPFLRIDRGTGPNEVFEITRETTIIGRHPTCDIVVENSAVSRQHVAIQKAEGGYLVEDLRSRNRTYLNGELIEEQMKLRDQDEICISEFHFFYAEHLPAEWQKLNGTDPELNVDPTLFHLDETGADSLESSSILGLLNLSDPRSVQIGADPEQKLRAVLDISKSLGSTLDLETVLDNTLEGLFQLFPQADHGFVLLAEDENRNRMRMRASKARAGEVNPRDHISMTVVKQAMESGDAVLSADVADDARFELSESVEGLQLRSILCVPLMTAGGESFGVVQLNTVRGERQFGSEDLDLLASVASQISLAVQNADLHEKMLAQRDMQRDLDFAMQVQLGFLPSQPPTIDNYEFHNYYVAAQQVGGDYFDYVHIPGGRIVISIGDVAGKGMPAALLMARLFASARYHLLSCPTLAEAMTALNSEIAGSRLGHRFITCLFAMLDPKENTLTVVNAGHLNPLIRSANGNVEPFPRKSHGMPIGITSEQTFETFSRILAPGDLFITFTDGITEAMNYDNDLYGSDRLAAYLTRGPENVSDLIDGVVCDVAEFCDGRGQRDDMCVVGFRRKK